MYIVALLEQTSNIKILSVSNPSVSSPVVSNPTVCSPVTSSPSPRPLDFEDTTISTDLELYEDIAPLPPPIFNQTPLTIPVMTPSLQSAPLQSPAATEENSSKGKNGILRIWNQYPCKCIFHRAC